MPANSAGACSSCPVWRATANGGTSRTSDLAADLTRRAGRDPAWWLVVRQYALGHARWPAPFHPRKPSAP